MSEKSGFYFLSYLFQFKCTFLTVNMLHTFCIHIGIKKKDCLCELCNILFFLRPISVLFCEYVLENVKNDKVVGVEWV